MQLDYHHNNKFCYQQSFHHQKWDLLCNNAIPLGSCQIIQMPTVLICVMPCIHLSVDPFVVACSMSKDPTVGVWKCDT